MRDDEEATVRDIAAHRVLITEIIQQHNGRVVDSPGDNILAEFASVVDAVNGAIKIQREIKESNTGIHQDRRMEFRIGINLGDVIEEDERIYGDGVNIAARVEGLAAGGGISISGTVYEHIKDKLSLGYHYLGEQEVKNIPEPIRVYRLLTESADAGKLIGEEKPKSNKLLWVAAAVVVLIILSICTITIRNYYFRPSFEPALIKNMAFPLPEKPSIAVLPFDNIGGDPEQEYFSDGLSESIITQLSQVHSLFVISRESTFAYKDKNVQVKQVAEEMSVRYILEGSVQSSGERIRVTAQLIDAISGSHVWADRYERELKDIFAIMDEITYKVVTELVGKLAEGEQSREVMQKNPKLEAYKFWLKSQAELRKFSNEGNIQARKLAKKAAEIDSQFSMAYSMIAWTYIFEVSYGRSKNPDQDFKMTDHFIDKALEVDPNNADAQNLLGFVYFVKGQFDKAISQGRRTAERWPNISDSHAILAWSLVKAGKPAEAIEEITIAMRLAPSYPPWFLNCLGQAYFLTGRYEEAIVAYKKFLVREPERIDLYAWLAVINSAMGNENQAQIEAKKLLKNMPTFSLKKWRSTLRFEDEAVSDRIIYYASKAGLPEYLPLKLPDKPSIAVLPFDNLSQDPEQEYFADGMTDDLITDLSKVSGLFVIARNSTFQYKGKAVDVKEVSRELGIRYVLEGSVRKAGHKVRINAQLIDATTGGHLWAERYDGQMVEIFSLQDKITKKIVAALAVTLTPREKESIVDKGTENIEAYDAFMKGWQHYLRWNAKDVAVAIQYFKKAIELDPKYYNAYAAMALIYDFGAGNGPEWTKALQAGYFASRARARLYLDMAMKKPTALAYRVASWMDLRRRQHDKALREINKAVAISPNDAEIQFGMARILVYTGKPKEALEVIKKVMLLDPNKMADCLFLSGIAYFYMERYEESMSSFERASNYNPDLWVERWFAIIYAYQGRQKDAEIAFNNFEKRYFGAVEGSSIGAVTKLDLQPGVYNRPFKDSKVTERYVNGLIKAGHPKPHRYYEVSKDNKLTGDEIRSLVFGRTAVGAAFAGGTWTVKNGKDGSALYEGYGMKDSGRNWIEGDQLCDQYKIFLGGLKKCQDVYRNPKGTPKGKDEYLYVNDHGMIPCSFVD
jgi:adenylate cyclase